jgi:hypothetical protein
MRRVAVTLGIAYASLALAAFVWLFSMGETDDFAGWVPVVVGTQLLWCVLVGYAPRPTTRIGPRAAFAAVFAGILVGVCGLASLVAPLELLETYHEDTAIVLGWGALGVSFVGMILCMVRFARLLAPVTARGVAAVLGVVGGTGAWAVAVAAVTWPLIDHRPGGFLQGIITMMAAACGAGALAWSLPLLVYVWLLRRRAPVDTTSPTP